MKAVLALTLFMALAGWGTSVARGEDGGSGLATTGVVPGSAPDKAALPAPVPADADNSVPAPVMPNTAPMKGSASSRAAAASGAEANKVIGRGKSLNFEDNVVEGMNQNPLDSLENINKRDGKDQSHLYRKRTDFRKEMKNTIQEGGFTP